MVIFCVLYTPPPPVTLSPECKVVSGMGVGYEGTRSMALAAAGRLPASTARYYSANGGGGAAARAAAVKISLDAPIISKTFHPIIVLLMVIVEHGSALELK